MLKFLARKPAPAPVVATPTFLDNTLASAVDRQWVGVMTLAIVVPVGHLGGDSERALVVRYDDLGATTIEYPCGCVVDENGRVRWDCCD